MTEVAKSEVLTELPEALAKPWLCHEQLGPPFEYGQTVLQHCSSIGRYGQVQYLVGRKRTDVGSENRLYFSSGVNPPEATYVKT